MKIGSYVLANSFSNVLSWVNPAELMLFGIGNTSTPWANESAPPAPSPIVTAQPELIGYIRVTSKRPVIETQTLQVGGVEVFGRFFMPVVATLAQLNITPTNRVLLEGTLFHSDVNSLAANYRSVGVYRQAIKAVGVLEPSFYTLSNITSRVFNYLLNTAVVSIQSGIEENIKIVLSL
jgi:hypothetical protein